ncbi:hypothetical protein KIW84_043556 [Lathyrus oleraceus]|uniref:MULE transposase domain-containing protein n=1 Tax=Pisum sativum TaxID=3888 RepID=A0A9D5ARX9_PEA|nr:hypothetical protein KIW84_043556 [Pisum sativum]
MTARFGTREEVIRWIKEVGIDNKVTVIITRSDSEIGKRGRSNKLIFGCDKGGKHKNTDSGTQSASKKCGCPFKIMSTPAKDGPGWKIDVKCGLHNHGLPDRLEGHSFIGRLAPDEKQHVADLTKRHVTPRHILLSLQDRDPENVTRITQNFCWVLEKLKELFVKKDLCPQVILTDRDLVLMKAIEIVFPRSINLLCRFHINKNVGAKCKQHVVNYLQKTIDTLWMEVVWASDEVEYGQRLHQLEQTCVDYSGFINYVKDTWLTPHRHRFVGAWINRVLHLGNTTTNRVEYAHWKLKQMLGNNIGDMGYLIENLYNVVLVCLDNPCMTFFPMTSSHSPNVSIYCIGFVNQNHWVRVNMKEGFPLPPITLDWKKFRCQIATSWMLGFVGRLQHWQLLTPILA